MSSSKYPPVISPRASDTGCLFGCGGIMFLAIFLPLTVSAVWIDGLSSSGDFVMILFVAAVCTAIGMGLILLFATIDQSRQRHAYERFRRRLMARPPMTDTDFRAAISDGDGPSLITFRHLLAESLGVPTESLRPEDDVRLSDGHHTGIAWYCVERVTGLSCLEIVPLVPDECFEIEANNSHAGTCASEARLFLRILSAVRLGLPHGADGGPPGPLVDDAGSV